MTILELLLWPTLACLVLTGIHAYLGLHVVERGVIFVDLSLAQVAALGTTLAFLAGLGLHSSGAYFVSLGFTLFGAALFALTRAKKSKIPQEAIIGIVYAVSAAASIMIMDRSPEGTEHIKYILVGNLLAVSPQEVGKTAVLYAFIGCLHWTWRKPFFTISTHPEQARQEGYSLRLWDFLFYATFGLVVTSSVAMAGVLLVFSYLIIPSVAAILFSKRVGPRLLIGWGVGILGSLLGLWGSYWLDAPTGATIICMFGGLLLLLSGVRALQTRGKA
ncbi:MAG: metal ABC transporter permease [Elusimicrobia bacterium]|nr:metal ABC transporter permease [Elusimicrobiota bacterium]